MSERGHHILVVDDDLGIRRLTTLVLESEGFDVETAVDGQDALRAISAADTPIDAVVTDLQMPNLDGWGLVSALRSRGFPLPLVVISATDPRSSGQLTVDSFIEKPFDPDDLVRELRRVIADRASHPPAVARTQAGATAAG